MSVFILALLRPSHYQERVDISMADSSIKEQRALYAQVALETPEVLNALIADLEGSSRRKRQAAASTLSVAASMKPEVLTEFSNVFVDALNRPEAQTRWECLDILTNIVGVESRLCDKAIPGAESALFDEDSGPLHLAAMRFLCRLGSTTETAVRRFGRLLTKLFSAITAILNSRKCSSLLSRFPKESLPTRSPRN